MQSPTVLVVMPLYNAARFVRKAVDSILSQTYPQYQVMIVDDGSTDGSSEIFSGKIGTKFVILRQKNSGPGAAMNRALSYAWDNKIPLIARMDADDISMPTRLEVQVRLLHQNPAMAACSANCFYMDSEREEIIGTSTVPSRSSLIKWEIKNGLRGMIQGASMFRTDALVKVGGYRPQFQLAEETDLFLRLAEKFELGNSKQYLYKIRMHQSSLSMHSVQRNVLHHFYALECARNRTAGNPETSFERFVEKLDWKLNLRIKREEFVLNVWRTAMVKRNLLALLFVSLMDPRRAIARVLRKL